MDRDCYIVEDLLPLYNEGLLHEETARWLESHIQSCEHCQKLASLSQEPIEQEPIHSSLDNEKMLKKINLRLSFYQIIFIAISFILAMKTSLLNESFGFILTYTILGLITYLFYRRMTIVVVIASLPNFIWSMVDSLSNESTFFHAVAGSLFLACLHLIFAVIGGVIGLLALKLKESGDGNDEEEKMDIH
ncbi:zf-HC2 domain-containing protein [Bacillus sp. SD088]|uniref:zf-HC2 domain-containing protein n=1 Tax=Bacillus sp. SD088 TaxID=2782012 RepID=UPI001A9760B1|nr:zf-HC2 domain-containing protein [Bacillus sp. SD088]MBO0991706.1 zf-HC2 domain-containing protein [Bacillus sp. SD088]